MNVSARRTFAFWRSREDRIVSFHPVEGYEAVDFPNRDLFLGEILAMSYAGYRFQ